MDSKAGLTRKQREFVESIERNTEGLTFVSTGVCPGCEQCRDELDIKTPCECGGESNWPEGEFYCDDCDGKGERSLTMAEFEEQWHNGEICDESGFSWQGCDLCGSSLGGNMSVWHAIDKDGNIIHGEHACVDCVVYLANGDLPE
jgi:hypothetical protein